MISDSKDAPTFANTIEELNYSGDLLNKVNKVFSNLKEANTNDSIQTIAQKVAPLLSQHEDAINLNDKLFARVKEVNDQKDKLKLNREQSRLLKKPIRNLCAEVQTFLLTKRNSSKR